MYWSLWRVWHAWNWVTSSTLTGVFVLLSLGTGCRGQVGSLAGRSGANDGIPNNAQSGSSIQPLRRLTPQEYKATVRTLFSLDVDEATLGRIPKDNASGKYDNAAAYQTIGLAHTIAYQQIAETVATQVVSSSDLRAKVFNCDVATRDRAVCVRTLARLAYRRPPTDTEVSRLVAVWNSADTQSDPWVGPRLVVETILQQPQLLFRIELGVIDTEHSERRKLDGYEVASRLAFGLWQSPPDSALLDFAEKGGLDTQQGVVDKAREMLNDPRSQGGIEAFAYQWMPVRAVSEVDFDTTAFPGFSLEMRAAAQNELKGMVTTYFGDKNILELYTAPHATSDAALSAIYAGSGTERDGLFGTAAYLMATSRRDKTSAVKRGSFVVSRALCVSVPPPVPGAESQQLHSENPLDEIMFRVNGCGGSCHASMDPIGLAFEKYDGIGKTRSTYPLGHPLPEKGWFLSAENEVRTPLEVGQRVSAHENAAQCITSNYFTWLFGDEPADTDAGDLKKATEQFVSSGHRFRELVVALTGTDRFRYIIAR